jgi:glycosyltransferase involved in cell wall biosynthesis
MEKNKLKILFTIPNFDTAGSGKALLNLALGLNKNKFEAHILCLNEKGEFFQTVKKSGIPVHVFDYLPKERPLWKLFFSCFEVAKKIKKINPDVVHSFHYNANYTEAISVRMAGVPWVFTKKNMNWGGASKNSWNLRSFLANKIAVQNTSMQTEFYPKSSKTVLIPRGVSFEKFKPEKPLTEIGTLTDISTKKRIIICVANLVPVKNIEVLLSAFDSLSSDFSNWEVWIAGDDKNEYGLFLKEFVREKCLENQIKFIGKIGDVRPFLNQAEIFVLPSKKEGSPVAFLEAMANGKVVLGSNIPGISDQLSELKEFLFESGNSVELSTKLKNLMSLSPEQLEEIGQKFSQYVQKNYDISIEIQRHEELYLSLFKK